MINIVDEYKLKMIKHLATLASSFGGKKKLLILIYHRVLEKHDFMRPNIVDKQSFTWHLNLLSQYFNVLSLDEALKHIENDTLPPRAICITFDDGYRDNYTNALPILKSFNLSATFFIASGFLDGGRMWNDTIIEAVRNSSDERIDLEFLGLGQVEVDNDNKKYLVAQHIINAIKHLPNETRREYTEYVAEQSSFLPNDLMMSSEQVKELHQSGMEIGGHTVNHPILAKLDKQSANEEIVFNKGFLDNLLKMPTKFFAYPNGKPGLDYLPDNIDQVRNAGYIAALSTKWGVVDKKSDRLQLSRFIPWDRTEIGFMARICRIYGAK